MRSAARQSSTSLSEAPREMSSGTMAEGKITTPRSGRMGSSAGTVTPLVSSSKPIASVPSRHTQLERFQRGARQLPEEMSGLARETGVTLEALTPKELLRRRPAARALVEELDGIVEEIEASGAHLKDVQLGLVDFPAELEGEIVYLCWQFGEPEVAFWHRIDDGFAGRQPLPGPARPRYLQC